MWCGFVQTTSHYSSIWQIAVETKSRRKCCPGSCAMCDDASLRQKKGANVVLHALPIGLNSALWSGAFGLLHAKWSHRQSKLIGVFWSCFNDTNLTKVSREPIWICFYKNEITTKRGSRYQKMKMLCTCSTQKVMLKDFFPPLLHKMCLLQVIASANWLTQRHCEWQRLIFASYWRCEDGSEITNCLI